MGSRAGLGCLIAVIAVVVIAVFAVIGTYNNLVSLSQTVDAQWAQVENVYQRRADLVPNLVATVKGAANFEKSTYIAVAQARAKVGQVQASIPPNVTSNAQSFAQYEAAQNGLTSALSRLLAVVENYPDLKASENFLTLQAQLEGTENRIAVERMRYNDDARAYDTALQSFPTVAIVGLFGDRFQPKQYFQAQQGAQTAPKVQF
jgi:LemA protein